MEKTVVVLAFAIVCNVYQAIKLDEVRKENRELKKENLELGFKLNTLSCAIKNGGIK